MEYMTGYQKELYKERNFLDNTSRTYNSNVLQSIHNGIDGASSAK